MGYHPLSDLGMTADERRSEAWRILEMFWEFGALGNLTCKEREFIDKMAQGFPVSDGQLCWLRDLKARHIE